MSRFVKNILKCHGFCSTKKDNYSITGKNRSRQKFYHISYRVLEKILYIVLYFSSNRYKSIERLDEKGDIIVSLTSFPPRMASVWMTIDSIMRQRIRPNRLILYLSADEFPEGIDGLPQNLKNYIPLGLEIEFRADNLRSHKKYIYAVSENPSSVVITVDDDIYYQSNTISSLLELHKRYPNAICANRSRKITFDSDGNFNLYRNWQNIYQSHTPSHLLVALGYGAILYPCLLIQNREMFDVEKIKKYCFNADDLWLKGIALTNDIPVVASNYMPHSPEVQLVRGVSLQKVNTSKTIRSGNDIQWENINKLYDFSQKFDK